MKPPQVVAVQGRNHCADVLEETVVSQVACGCNYLNKSMGRQR